MKDQTVRQAYQIAAEQYGSEGVDVESALARLASIPISLHCWQGDDVGGFEKPGAQLSGGGIQATGNYPGRRAPSPSCAPTSKKRSAWFLAGTGSICTRRISTTAEGRSNATRSRSGIFKVGSTGRASTAWGWTSTRRTSLIPRPRTASRSPIPTRRSANSGSRMGSPAGRLERPWAGNSARQP